MTTLIVLLFILINREWLSVGTILVQSLYDEECVFVMLVKIQLSNNNINRSTTFFNKKFIKTIKLNYEFYNYYYPGLSPSCKRCFTLLALPLFPCFPPILRYQYTNVVVVSKLQNFTFSQKNVQQLNPWWVTGFSDGDGCMRISIIENKRYKVGWAVLPIFQITLKEKDKPILVKIQNFFAGGSISFQPKQKMVQYRVCSPSILENVINHFEKFPLITDKRADYELLKHAVKLIELKEHLTFQGLRKIVALKASMNLGLSKKLLAAFPDVIPVTRLLVKNKKIQDPNWVAGFTSAEGCFNVQIKANQKQALGVQVQLAYQVTQHNKDKQLMENFKIYLGSGSVRERKRGMALDYIVEKFSDNIERIIPFFQKYPIVGVKELDFADWCEVAEMIKDKKHLSAEGLDKIKKIKARMNTGRK